MPGMAVRELFLERAEIFCGHNFERTETTPFFLIPREYAKHGRKSSDNGQ
jgi:hypothetical protein